MNTERPKFHVDLQRAIMPFQSSTLTKPACQYKMSEVAVRAGIDPPHMLLLRDVGELALPILREMVCNLPEGQPLVLQFHPEQRLDVSFADAAFVKLALQINRGECGENTVLFKDLTDNFIENIEGAIAFRNLKLALLAVFSDGSWRCIGQLEKNLRDTLDQVAKHDGLGAGELADMFELAINTASNRLKKLHDQHLVRREAQVSERGFQYIYHFWNW